MKRKSMLSALFMMGMSAVLIAGCSSNVKKADIASTANPREEIAKLSTDIGAAISDNVDVLAASEFQYSVKYLNKAEKALANGDDQVETLDALRTGRGYLQEARKIAATRDQKAEGLFAARQMALEAGATRHSELKSDMQSLDGDLISQADELDTTSAEDLVELQNRYVELERKAVVLTQLGEAIAMVNGAREHDAAKRVPKTLKNAELAVTTAESMISTNVRNPAGYKAAVEKATTDTNHLIAVLNASQQGGHALPEATAIKMVAQSTKISKLTANRDAANAKSEASNLALEGKNQELATDIAMQDEKMAAQDQEMLAANRTIEIQKAMEAARTQFTGEEAEAYQQGENLVIRLKQVAFASGRSEIPSVSMPLLARISEVAKSLNASQMMIEGHTDSVGGEAINKTISNKRAEAVATYFKSNGFNEIEVLSKGWGFAKPIASNSSKEGRAQNRRVDIIITPEVATQ